MLKFPDEINNLEEYYQLPFEDFYSFEEKEGDKFFLNNFILEMELFYHIGNGDFPGLNMQESEFISGNFDISFCEKKDFDFTPFLSHLVSFQKFIRDNSDDTDNIMEKICVIFNTENFNYSKKTDRYDFYKGIIRETGLYELNGITDNFNNQEVPVKSVIWENDYPLYKNNFYKDDFDSVYRTEYFKNVAEKFLRLHLQAIYIKLEDLVNKKLSGIIYLDSAPVNDYIDKWYFTHEGRAIDKLYIKSSGVKLYNSKVPLNIINPRKSLNDLIKYIWTVDDIDKINILKQFNAIKDKEVLDKTIKNSTINNIKSKRL